MIEIFAEVKSTVAIFFFGRTVNNVLSTDDSRLVVNVVKSWTSIWVATVPPIATPVTVETPVIVMWDAPTETTLANTGSLVVLPGRFTSE